jgi:hypothetical protein
MATLTQAFTFSLERIAYNNKRDEIIERFIPRRCMVISVGVILAGMIMPMLMLIQLLSVNLILGFLCFSLVASGGVLAIIHYCEI